MEMGDARFGRLLLYGALEEEFIDFPHGQALRQKIERAVFDALAVAATVGLAATGKAFAQRGAQTVWIGLELGEQPAFALAECEGGFAGGVVYLRHMYGEDNKTATIVKQ